MTDEQRDRRRAYQKDWEKAHAEERREYMRQWRKAHPELVKAQKERATLNAARRILAAQQAMKRE